MGGTTSTSGFLDDPDLSSRQDLNRFIDDNIQPNEYFLDQCGQVINNIYLHLQDQFRKSGKYNFSVNRIVKGGSLGKGTAVRGKSDVDIVVLFNGFTSINQFQKYHSTILQELVDCIKALGRRSDLGYQVEWKTTTSRAVKFTFKCTPQSDEIDVDLLPSFPTTLSRRQDLYDELKQLPLNKRCDPVFSERQVNFVKERVPNVKRLIRLVKYWRKIYVPDDWHYPSSYPFELLTIYVWESAGSPGTFNIVHGFHQVLTYLADYSTMKFKIMWTSNYTCDDIDQSLLSSDSGPVIIDPANPTVDVWGTWYDSYWSDVAQRARTSLQSEMLSKVEVNPGWDKGQVQVSYQPQYPSNYSDSDW